MKAIFLRSPGDVLCETGVLMPRVIMDTDAIVYTRCCSICGSDLHPYRGEIPAFMPNCCMGHEFVGEIVEVGRDVRTLRIGDLVLASDLIACGTCRYCAAGLHYHCPRSTLFGYGTVVGEYVAGGQAEFVRVPFADYVLKKLPEGLDVEKAIFVTDNLTTAYAGLERSRFRPGEDVLVIGCGSVGLCTILAAIASSAARVFAVDPSSTRAELARSLGAVVTTGTDTFPEWLADQVGRGGISRIVEAVGTASAMRLAISAVGIRGTISVVGAHGRAIDSFDAQRCFVKEASICFTVGNPMKLADHVLSQLSAGALDPTPIISHRMQLADAPVAYRLLDEHQAVKILMTTG